MRLTKKHIERITAILPADIEPLVLKNNEEQRQFLKTWQEKLKQDRRMYAGLGEMYTGSNRSQGQPHLSIHLQTPHKGYDTVWAEIKFNDLGELVLNTSNYDWRLNDLHQITLFANKVSEFFTEKHNENLKKEKIQNLKTGSIIAKLAEIAREDKFEYAYEQSARQVTLFIKLSKRDMLSIRVPFTNFQEIMQRVRPIIQTVRELSAGGVVFQIKQAGWQQWISPKK